MLVASSPIVPDHPAGQVHPDRYACRSGRSVSAFRRSGPAKPGPAMEPAIGPVRRLVGFRRTFPSARRFQPYRCIPSVRLPFARSLPHGCFPAVPSGAFVHLAEARLSSLFQRRSDAVYDCAPLAASAVRQAYSKESARRVFRRCCGHRCRLFRVQFLQLCQGLTPSRAGDFFPSDGQKLRPMSESRKRFL